jgi:hypothetical protein
MSSTSSTTSLSPPSTILPLLVQFTHSHENFNKYYGKLMNLPHTTTTNNNNTSNNNRPTTTTSTTTSNNTTTNNTSSSSNNNNKRQRSLPTTSTTSTPLNTTSRIFGLDCEMVKIKTSTGDERLNIARTSLVELIMKSENDNVETKIILDEFCNIPSDCTLVDLLTDISGITQEMLTNAKYNNVEEIVQLIQNHVQSHDILVGHSLNMDLSSLGWGSAPSIVTTTKQHYYLPNIIDTSFFFKLKNAPSFTFSLKDCASLVLGMDETSELQKQGESHDSIKDAIFALQIVVAIIKRYNSSSSSSSIDNKSLEYEIEEIPERFLRRLTFRNMEILTTDSNLSNEIFLNQFIQCPAAKIIQKRAQSWIIEFDTMEECLKCFLALPTQEENFHKDGYPMKDGFRTKKCRWDNILLTDVVCYIRPKLCQGFELSIPNSVIGKVMGIKGKRILILQQICGARIITIPEKSNHKITQLVIEADDKRKIAVAVSLITRAQAGEEFGISNNNNNNNNV